MVGFGRLPIGIALAAVHLIGIPLTGTGVNPARSLAPALFAGGPALTQLWLFLVAPLVGAGSRRSCTWLRSPHGGPGPRQQAAEPRTGP